MKLHWVRNEIARMRGQIRAQAREIHMLQRAGVATVSAELLLSRMRAKVDDLCRERGALRKAIVGKVRARSISSGRESWFTPAKSLRPRLRPAASGRRSMMAAHW
ncbi:hypothetical protein [Bradyrhizobium sp. 23]|uniref:hypothetical protein n=2 Tax=Bradyrhizobium TaxID=374 RepID=UPI001FFC0F2F|nr:hypothetical protein [Bradyrhizobium sp. 23]